MPSPESLSPEDLALLLRAAQSLGLDPAKLQARNPWSFEGGTARTLQAAVCELDPAAAQRMQEAAGVSLSLGAQAALAGLTPWTPELEAEAQAVVPDTFRQLQQKALDDAADSLFAAFNDRREAATQLAERYRWNVDALAQDGHHLAATVAAERRDRLAAEARRQQIEDSAWLHQRKS